MSEFGSYYQIVCCVKCGEECGNGFLIDGHTIVTASHILAPYRCDKSFSISVQFEDADSHIICEVLSDGSDGNPVSLLSLPCDRDTFCRKLNDAELKEDELAAAYGFAGTIQSKVDRLSLKCVRVFGKVVKPAGNGNVSFNPIEEHRPNFKGFSGPPIVYKGGIIGMLLAQSSNNGVADRLYGICGLAFREFLSSLGVSLPVDKTPIDLRQSNQSALSTPPVAQTTISEIDILLSKLFEPVRNAHESGQALKSRKSLVKFFDTLESINCTDKKKAEFFYLGALWMRIDGTNDAAEKYYVKAKEYFPGLNNKVYRAYELLQGGRISEAQRLLLPVSDTVELNALLACLIEDKIALPEILTEIGKVDIQKDCYAHRLLAIAALQSEEYSAGLEYIHKAAPAGTINPDNAVIESLLHFWSAMRETYPDTNRLGFVFASNRRFYPTIRQQEELEAAYDILLAANESGTEGISEFQRQTILWGLVAISDLIPGKDSQYWLNRFKDAAPNHPFTILYSISKGISLAEKDKNDFLNRPTQGQSGIYAYAKLQLLLSLKKYDEAKAYFEEHKESIAHYKSSSVAEEELEVLFACHDYSAAKEILGQVDMQSEVKERYALGIQFNLSGKARKELIRNATEFAEKTGQPIDYYNAGVMCSKFSKWKDAIANARRWWAKTREQIALEFLAEAYYNKGDHKKCLKIIDKAKCNGTLWEGIIKFEINSLAAMAKYNEARVQSQALGYTVTDPRGKYIVFCANAEHMRQMMAESKAWFSGIDQDFHSYSVYSDDPEASQSFAEFKADDSDHLRLLFCIDALNEGIHVDDVAGVILLRPTVSPIIFKQQIGRALSASSTKNPVIFDVVNNISGLYSISSLQDEMSEIVRYYQYLGEGENIVNQRFEIFDDLKDCRRIFDELETALSASWEYMFDEASAYFKRYGDLLPGNDYVTEDGMKLGKWLVTQRINYRNGSGISQARIEKLNAIGMDWRTLHERQWDEGYALAKAYFEKHGSLETSAEMSPKLSNWLVKQRQRQRENEMPYEQFEKLSGIGMIWEFEDTWERKFELAKKFYEINGNLDIPAAYVTDDGTALGAWLRGVKNQYRGGNLSTERIAKLESIGVEWESVIARNWANYFELAKKYYEEHGDLNVNAHYEINGVKLGTWISSQRESFKKGRLSDEQINKLNEIGMSWQRFSGKWDNAYEYAKAYVKEHGSLDPPAEYKADDGFALGAWVASQRVKYADGKLKPTQIKRLNELKISWDVLREAWQNGIDHAKAYHEKFGNLNVPGQYECEDGYKLGVWIANQRSKYKSGKLMEERKNALEALGIKWDSHKDRWQTGFEHAREYYKKNGDLNVPQDFVCDDGYTLNNWIAAQRKAYKNGKLTDERITSLNKIGMIWNQNDCKWDNGYRYALSYCKRGGGLPIPQTFVTPDGYPLGEWVRSQKRRYRSGRLEFEKVRKLAEIGVRLDGNAG